MSESKPSDSDEELLQDVPSEAIGEGERLMISEITGNTYRVTKWIDRGGGKAIALEKELVAEGEEGDDE